ncbi:Tetraketide alpha-pyrone reductase 1 [Vitis vinifera]|uniref:Tetraketide alpha-pyrone reductase 1 n=1 Tax=Vitis vinifera TaxID=29760 RepID=A0A438EKS9_VITVI|nr:Tetraketide alpha-pyrone reductase 1 [Vitis vinifera]
MAEILVPAVEGTLNVLRSCKKNPSLRRVVLTSSTSLWNFVSASRQTLHHGIAVGLPDTDKLIRVLAEKAAWEFCKENGIDLVTIVPSCVVGPGLPPDLCSTASNTLALLKGMERLNWNKQGRLRNADGLEGWNMFTSMMLHSATSILVYEHEDAHGRYLCSSAELDDNELTSLLSARYPSLPIPKRSDALDIPYVEFNTSKLKSLGFKFKSIQDMFDDCIASLVEEGHLGQVKFDEIIICV